MADLIRSAGIFVGAVAPTVTYPYLLWQDTTTGLFKIRNAANSAWHEIAPNATYKTLYTGAGSHTAARAAGTYGFAYGDALAISGTGTLYPLASFHLQAADYPTVNGKAPVLRVDAQLHTNDVAPTGTYTVGLHPITRPATSGGAGLAIYTIGAAVASSTVLFTTPAADTSNTGYSSDFTFPADGHYVLGMVQTGTVAASAHMHMTARLSVRNA